MHGCFYIIYYIALQITPQCNESFNNYLPYVTEGALIFDIVKLMLPKLISLKFTCQENKRIFLNILKDNVLGV